MKKRTAKILDEIEIPNRFADAEKAFEKGRQKLLTITPGTERDPSRERKGGTVNSEIKPIVAAFLKTRSSCGPSRL